MPRCKPGDLAIVVSAHNRANVGRIVQVLRLHDGRGELAYASTEGIVWLVRDAGGRRMALILSAAQSTRSWYCARPPRIGAMRRGPPSHRCLATPYPASTSRSPPTCLS